MPVTSWSTTAATNATADSASGIVWSEGQAPASVNDSARSMMAVIKGDLANSLVSNGYQKFPNGLIIQWGLEAGSAADRGITYPITFPTAVLQVLVSTDNFGTVPATTQLTSCSTSTPTTSNFTIYPRYVNNGGAVGVSDRAIRWIAVGY